MGPRLKVALRLFLFKRFAHSAEPRHLGCSVVDLLGLCLCAGLWVCVFLFFSFVVRLVWGCLCTFWCVLGLFWGPFLGFGGALGFVLRALGVPWVALGVLGGRFGRPGGPKSNFLTFCPSHFGVILAAFRSSKSMQNLMSFFVGFPIDF